MLVLKLSWISSLLFLCPHGAEAKSVEVCEGNSASLQCDTGFIKVLNANYGRTDCTVCAAGKPAHQLSNNNCKKAESLSIMSALCDGLKSCTVSAVNSVFSDPCVGTYKYLALSYDCIPAKERSVVACEGNSASLQCDTGFIKVLNANYGRTDCTVCATGKPAHQLSNNNCKKADSLSIMSARCDGLKSCTVSAVNSVFSDPCVGTYKYLTLSYDCIPAKRNVTCAGQKSIIECEVGVLSIHHANYGRRDLETCPHKLATTCDCYSPQTSSLVSSCNGKKSCQLDASNSVFSDPCVGVHKYLEVTYSCKCGCNDGT
ncbi:L-rhamnose-binding lectin CSL3-like [Pseudorasbora parva]|uniref:L-rhamnose-binding lectin CSL3-like n=1 Tax=Pseudorasbora parva TaxID=51549 RepID=UPI00351E2725